MPERHRGGYIGALAAELGVNPRTIRYYERIGLLKAPARTGAGYRLYSLADRARLRFILKGKASGLTLAEVSELLSLRERGVAPCDRLVTLIDDKLESLQCSLEALADLRQELIALRREAVERRPQGRASAP